MFQRTDRSRRATSARRRWGLNLGLVGGVALTVALLLLLATSPGQTYQAASEAGAGPAVAAEPVPVDPVQGLTLYIAGVAIICLFVGALTYAAGRVAEDRRPTPSNQAAADGEQGP